jgi:hypothetical protein
MKTIVVFVAMLVLLVPGAALATNQQSEVIYLDGQKHWLHTLPWTSITARTIPVPISLPTPPINQRTDKFAETLKWHNLAA